MNRSRDIWAGFLWLAALTFMAAPALTRAGAITEIGPFVGAWTEDWESYPSLPGGEPFYLPNPARVMQDHATLTGIGLAIFDPPIHTFHLGSSGSAKPSDGSKGMGINGTGSVIIVFDVPVTRFGSYWGAVTSSFFPPYTDPAVIQVEFYDEAGFIIDSISFDYSRSIPGLPDGDGILEWHGWESYIPVSFLIYSGDGVAVDGWRAQPIPEPTTVLFILLAIGMTQCRLRGRNDYR